MVQGEIKPINERGRRAPKGALTWAALAGVVVFVIALIAMFARPAVNRHDGPESTVAGPPAATAGQTPAPGG